MVYEPVCTWYRCDFSVSLSPLDLGMGTKGLGLGGLELGLGLDKYLDQVDGK